MPDGNAEERIVFTFLQHMIIGQLLSYYVVKISQLTTTTDEVKPFSINKQQQ
jgi:hypothetical protein